MSQVIATIVEIQGEVLAQNTLGEVRLLDAGSKLYEGETIKTGVNGFVVLQLSGEEMVTIQSNQLVELTDNVLADKVVEQSDSIQEQSIEEVLAILQSGGDLTEQLEAPAAGGADATDNGGAMTLRLLSLAEAEGAQYQEEGGVPIVSRVVETVTPSIYTPNTFVTTETIEPTDADTPLPIEENSLPIAVSDGFELVEDSIFSGSVASNDVLSNDGGNIFNIETLPENGTIEFAKDGNFTYTPNDNYHGDDSFSYTLTDANGDSSTATVNIIITPVTDAMADLNETITTPEDTPVSGNVLDNLTDTDSTSHSVTSFTVEGSTYAPGTTATVAGGTLSIASNGAYTFTPDANFNGNMPQATYSIVDNNDASDTDTSTLDVTVTPVNDPPVITEGTFADVSEANLADGTQPDSALLTDSSDNHISIVDSDSGDEIWINGIKVVNSDNSLTGNSVVTDSGTLTFTSYEDSQLNYTYTLNDNHVSDVVTYDDTVTVRTEAGDVGGDVIKIAQIIDDAPTYFTTDPVVIQSDGSDSGLASLNFSVDDGADNYGSLHFKTDSSGNLLDPPELYFNSGSGTQLVNWVLTQEGTVATGQVNGINVITISLNGAADSYSVTSNADGTFLAPGETLPTVNSALTTANNKLYSGAVNIEGSIIDIVITGSDRINTTPKDIGIGDQWLEDGEHVTISFYTNSTLNGSSNVLSFDGPAEAAPIVNFNLLVYQVGGNKTASFDVHVIDSNGIESPYGVYTNVTEGSTITISSSSEFTDIVGVKVYGTGGKFSMQAGDLDYLNPSDLSFDMSIVGTDADNDSVDSSITIGIDQDSIDGVLIDGEPATTYGQIIDGFVGGLAYETSSGITGFTSENGGFNYKTGDTISFSIGNVLLGTIAADDLSEAMTDGKLFLQEIAGVEQTDLNHEYVENMAVLLQTLDSNADVNDGIQISAAMHEAFSDDTFDLSTISGEELHTILEDNGLTPVSEEDAMAHVQEMLVESADIDPSEINEHIADMDPSEFDEQTSDNEPLVDSDEDLDYSLVIAAESSTETGLLLSSTDENPPIPIEELISDQNDSAFDNKDAPQIISTVAAVDNSVPVPDDVAQQLINDELDTEDVDR